MAPPPIILDLVEHFARNADVYRNSLNEAEVRVQFIDPFFEALGWDIHNKQHYAETYKDVSHEYSIQIGPHTEAPDYCFRVGGTRKFFVEAKRPAVHISVDPAPAFQLRSYAWTSKLPLSLLSNFAEFSVYDCRTAPHPSDKASVARIDLITFDQYPDRWEDIASRFSREAVYKGSFDRYTESSKLKKGTTEVDDAFLAEIKSWREELASNLALRNPSLSQREVNFAVQRTIDRIIFLRMCEDRGIEKYGQLQELQQGERIYQRLCTIYERADEKFNSGLFHFNEEKDRAEAPDTLTRSLEIDDTRLKSILKRLYYPESPYKFSHFPADILGQVYEQFLGYVIRLTPDHHAKVVAKPEFKKAEGVYYTPTYIVDYIVRNTVGKLLDGKTPKQATKLRVLDPACGSGSFLLGAYEYLLNWHRDWYLADGAAKYKKALYRTQGGGWQLTSAEKKRILLSNIHGVDIDTQAVEVTKLSLLLKVMEGENEQTIGENLKLFHERALPDLGNNIKCGNSLIASDFYKHQQLLLIDEEERLRINVFDWEGGDGFPDIMKAGGFDAVIGNPPYGALLSAAEKEYLNNIYKLQSYQLDSYLLFLERALAKLVGTQGYYGMIIPNPWLTNLLQTRIREFAVTKVTIQSIVHFFFKVFSKVTVDTEIVVIQNTPPKNVITEVLLPTSRNEFEVTRDFQVLRHDQRKWQTLSGRPINIFLERKAEALARKCLNNSKPLEHFCAINVGIKPYQAGKGTPPQTKQIVEKRPFDSNYAATKAHRPCLRGGDIFRYRIHPENLLFLRFGPWLAEPRPAADFEAPLKIFVRQTGDSIIAAMDKQQRLCMNNVHVVVPHPEANAYFLLGVLNSRLINWYYQTINPERGEALAEVKKTNLAQLPIRYSNKFEVPAAKLVNSIMALYAKLCQARTDHERTALQRQIEVTDHQIDALVYQLYGVTEDEIKAIEAS